MLLGPKHTMLKSKKPVIAVCATRTGCGKSQTSRKIVELLMAQGLKVVVVRHPMPYGDLARSGYSGLPPSRIWPGTTALLKRWKNMNPMWCGAM